MRKTNPYLLLTVFVILMAIGYFFFIQKVPEPIPLDVKEVMMNPVVSDRSLTKTKKLIAQKPLNKTPEYEEISSESDYSSDPIVELSLIYTTYHVCIQYFKDKTSSSRVSRFKTDIQHDYYNKVTLHCEELNKTHPEYLLDDPIKLLKARMHLKGTSRLGELLKYSKEPYSIEETLYVNELVGKEYPELLNSDLIYKTWQYQIDVTNPNLRHVLSTTNIDYVSEIISHTKKYLACELGVSCSYDSKIMFNYCRTEPNFCVNDFKTLFNTRFSAAVRADILLALPHIKQVYHVN
jgi:hypothetical protein